jgi:hypothetical protein
MPHPNAPASGMHDWSLSGVPHPNSPAGQHYEWATAGIPHPNSPAGQISSTGPKLNLKQRFMEMVKLAPNHMAPELAAQFRAMLTPSAIAGVAATFTALAVSQAFGIGEVVDLILLVVGAFVAGMAVFPAAENIVECVKTTVRAKTPADLERAADYLAQAIAILRVVVFFALIEKISEKFGGAASAEEPGSAEEPSAKPPDAPPPKTSPAPKEPPAKGATNPSGEAGGALPTSIPKTCKDAPKSITIPKNVNADFKKLWGDSFPDGKSQEHGGTLVQDKNGNVTVVNKGSGTSGTFSPNRTVAAGQTIIGIFHTHPYDESEGGATGVSFSGADIAIAANQREPSYVQSGDTQFMVMPTEETPKSIDYSKVNAAQNKRIQELVDSGKDFSEATRTAANETAQANKMAYYEGKDGVLKRISC